MPLSDKRIPSPCDPSNPLHKKHSLYKRLYSMRGKIVDGMATDEELLNILAEAAEALPSHVDAPECCRGLAPKCPIPELERSLALALDHVERDTKEIERLHEDLAAAGDGDTWEAAYHRVMAELEALRIHGGAPPSSIGRTGCNHCGGLGYVLSTDGLGQEHRLFCPCAPRAILSTVLTTGHRESRDWSQYAPLKEGKALSADDLAYAWATGCTDQAEEIFKALGDSSDGTGAAK